MHITVLPYVFRFYMCDSLCARRHCTVRLLNRSLTYTTVLMCTSSALIQYDNINRHILLYKWICVFVVCVHCRAFHAISDVCLLCTNSSRPAIPSEFQPNVSVMYMRARFARFSFASTHFHRHI